MPDHPRIITCSLLLYRCLLTLAPEEFAGAYTEPALQVFRQCCRDAYREGGTRGVLRLWLPTFFDALRGILAEQLSALKLVLCPRLAWPVGLALGCVLFPFYWLSRRWLAFGRLFDLIFTTPQAYIAGHIVLFCAAGLVVLCFLPALHRHVLLYVSGLMFAALAEETLQVLFNAHPGLHKDARNLLVDLCGIILAALLWRLWQSRRMHRPCVSQPPL
ncbi:MAG TPA: hypothetical protein VGF67_16145 [Ktedonobacteraceae bacterium]